VPPHVARADEEDVADAGGGALVSERFFDLGDGDLVAADGRGRVAVLGLVPAELCQTIGEWSGWDFELIVGQTYPVHKNSAAYDTASFAHIW